LVINIKLIHDAWSEKCQNKFVYLWYDELVIAKEGKINCFQMY